MRNTDFREGIKGGLYIALSAAPFGALFGAVAVDNGLTIAEAVVMSGTVYAGASQIVGIELFGKNVEPWLIILSVLAVNFRHILYSAAMTRLIPHWSLAQKLVAFAFLVDPQFAESAKRAESGRKVSYKWYMGLALAVYFPWLMTTAAGAWFGNMIGDPKSVGLDVLLPIYFMGLVLGFRKRASFYPVMAASAVGSTLAYHWVGSPWHVSFGALAGVAMATILPPDISSTDADDIAPLDQGA